MKTKKKTTAKKKTDGKIDRRLSANATLSEIVQWNGFAQLDAVELPLYMRIIALAATEKTKRFRLVKSKLPWPNPATINRALDKLQDRGLIRHELEYDKATKDTGRSLGGLRRMVEVVR